MLSSAAEPPQHPRPTDADSAMSDLSLLYVFVSCFVSRMTTSADTGQHWCRSFPQSESRTIEPGFAKPALVVGHRGGACNTADIGGDIVSDRRWQRLARQQVAHRDTAAVPQQSVHFLKDEVLCASRDEVHDTVADDAVCDLRFERDGCDGRLDEVDVRAAMLVGVAAGKVEHLLERGRERSGSHSMPAVAWIAAEDRRCLHRSCRPRWPCRSFRSSARRRRRRSQHHYQGRSRPRPAGKASQQLQQASARHAGVALAS